MQRLHLKNLLATGAVVMLATLLNAHGDVNPQAVDTSGLPETGDEWLTENPYRAEAAGEDVWATAVQIGASGYIKTAPVAMAWRSYQAG